MHFALLTRFRGVVIFILLAAMGTLTMGTIYATVQQGYRQGANDPQIEASEEIAALINQGTTPEAIIGQGGNVDMAKSLAIVAAIYDNNGKAIGGSGKLNGTLPVPPAGVFAYVSAHGENRFTWEPQAGVRMATVLRKTDKGSFVLVARSLREVEKREATLTAMVAIAWFGLMLLSAALAWLLTCVGSCRHEEVKTS